MEGGEGSGRLREFGGREDALGTPPGGRACVSAVRVSGAHVSGSRVSHMRVCLRRVNAYTGGGTFPVIYFKCVHFIVYPQYLKTLNTT